MRALLAGGPDLTAMHAPERPAFDQIEYLEISSLYFILNHRKN